ncbi:hypothetical protein K501DRAFT_255348 [Backusella circina FSU 941]|nr:hypothetical protein K501DRAFT_255348 [Backusella circina FSU 941]
MSNHNLSIELLPEFGWCLTNQNVYGPGSVFQGAVKLELSKDTCVEKIRLGFTAIESIPPYEVCPGSVRSSKDAIFTTQQTLWESSDKVSLLGKQEYNYPFIIQMPMIQFPPSFKDQSYSCQFQLIAVVDLYKQDNIKCALPILYSPFVETRALKIPLMKMMKVKNLTAKVRLVNQDFVPGDVIDLKLHVDNESKKKNLQSVTATMQLKQIIHNNKFDDVPDRINIITSISHKLLLINSPHQENQYYCDGDLKLKLPEDLVPSFEYSKLASVSYVLCVFVEKSGPLGGIWNYRVDIEEIPVKIGTMGHGIRASDELKLYSKLESNTTTLLPRFLKEIEYEDALPLYEPSQLPTYDVATTMPMIESL